MCFQCVKGVSKLRQAMQQRLQLATQQAYNVGGFLCHCINAYSGKHADHETDGGPLSRGRPRMSSLLDIPC